MPGKGARHLAAGLAVTAWQLMASQAGVIVPLPEGISGLAWAGEADPQTIVLQPGAALRRPLDQPQHSYIRGTLIASGPVTLSVSQADGQPLRRLIDQARGEQSFHFVVEAGMQQVILTNPGQDVVNLQLTLDLAVPEPAASDQRYALLSPTLAGLADRLAAGGTTDEFWAARQAEGTPMIEPSTRSGYVIATFLWRGAARNVRLWGAPAYDHTWLQRLGDSDLWFASFEIPADTRLSYGLAPDVPEISGTASERRRALLATLQADPLNRYPTPSDAPDRWARRSVMELPAAPEQPGSDGGEVKNPGSIRPIRWHSAILGNSRQVDLYIPAGFIADDPQAVLLYLFDGPRYNDGTVSVPKMLDRLIADGRLPPIAVALIDPIDGPQRDAELTCNPKLPQALADELHPLLTAALGQKIGQKIGHEIGAQRVAIAGSSYGGLAAACAALARPERFGNVIALSGSFWWRPDKRTDRGTNPLAPFKVPQTMPWMSALWAKKGPKQVRFWLSAGIFEAAADPREISILSSSRHLHDSLLLGGQAWVRYREYSGGHDYLIWRGAIADALLDLFGRGGDDPQ